MTGDSEGPSKRIDHVLHAFLTIFTGGLWAVIWIALVLRNRGI